MFWVRSQPSVGWDFPQRFEYDRFGGQPPFRSCRALERRRVAAEAGLFGEQAVPNTAQTDRAATSSHRIAKSILPETEEIRFTQPTDVRPTPSVEFLTPYGWVPLRSLGHGYRTLIAWMVDFAGRMMERYPESPNPLGEPAVVLVDEIDLHLHPSWQRKLIHHLNDLFSNTQFIATAHSPLIVLGAGDANIAVLRREGDHVVIDNDFEAIRGWRVDQILTSDLFDLPTARPPEFDAMLAQPEGAAHEAEAHEGGRAGDRQSGIRNREPPRGRDRRRGEGHTQARGGFGGDAEEVRGVASVVIRIIKPQQAPVILRTRGAAATRARKWKTDPGRWSRRRLTLRVARVL